MLKRVKEMRWWCEVSWGRSFVPTAGESSLKKWSERNSSDGHLPRAPLNEAKLTRRKEYWIPSTAVTWGAISMPNLRSNAKSCCYGKEERGSDKGLLPAEEERGSVLIDGRFNNEQLVWPLWSNNSQTVWSVILRSSSQRPPVVASSVIPSHPSVYKVHGDILVRYNSSTTQYDVYLSQRTCVTSTEPEELLLRVVSSQVTFVHLTIHTNTNKFLIMKSDFANVPTSSLLPPVTPTSPDTRSILPTNTRIKRPSGSVRKLNHSLTKGCQRKIFSPSGWPTLAIRQEEYQRCQQWRVW